MKDLLFGDLVYVNPISNLGKSRVAEYGNVWKITNIKMKKNAILVIDTKDCGYTRWIEDNDKDFEILYVLPAIGDDK